MAVGMGDLDTTGVGQGRNNKKETLQVVLHYSIPLSRLPANLVVLDRAKVLDAVTNVLFIVFFLM